jgi:hypothetical protein
LFSKGTWRRSHPSKWPHSCWTWKLYVAMLGAIKRSDAPKFPFEDGLEGATGDALKEGSSKSKTP